MTAWTWAIASFQAHWLMRRNSDAEGRAGCAPVPAWRNREGGHPASPVFSQNTSTIIPLILAARAFAGVFLCLCDMLKRKGSPAWIARIVRAFSSCGGHDAE